MDLSPRFLRHVLTVVFIAVGLVVPVILPLQAQAPGTVDPVFGGESVGLLGQVYVLAIQPDGKVLVGGDFGTSLIRLNVDGSQDTSFQASVAGVIFVLTLQPDGKIVTGGLFVPTNATAYSSVVRLNADGSLDTSFHASSDEVDIDAQSLALQPDGKIVLGGYFTPVNGVRYTGLIRLNADGSRDASFQASTDDEVRAISLRPDGEIFIGGTFTQVNGAAHTHVACLNADGSVNADFQASINGAVYASALQPNGKILVSGGSGLARLNADGSLDTSFQPSFGGGGVLALQSDGKIITGYTVFQANDTFTDNIVRLNADGSLDASFQVSTYFSSNDGVRALALQPDGEFLVGGDFIQVNGVGTTSVVRLKTGGQVDHLFNADDASGPNAKVFTVVIQPDGKILLGGSFTQVNGANHPGLARLSADGSLDASFQSNIGARFIAVQPDGKILIDGGYVTQAGGTVRSLPTRLNADGSEDTSFQAGPFGGISAMVLQPDGKILFSSNSPQADGSVIGLIRLNADGSVDTSFKTGTSGVETLALQPDGKILIGGYSTRVNGVDYYGVVRLNADGSLDTSFQVGRIGVTSDLALQSDGKVLIDSDAFGLLRFNADGSLDESFQGSGYVGIMALQPDGKILIAREDVVVRLNADGSPDTFFNPDGSGPNNYVLALKVQADGKILVGGNFTSYNGVVRNHVARLNGGGAPDFFNGAQSVGGGFYYEQFPNGSVFGYYNVANFPIMYHADMGFEYFIDAGDGHAGAYLYDFKSNTFWYTSPTFPFPYLYDFSLKAFLYYYPDPNNAGHYNTNGVRYFFNFATGKIITK